MGHYVNADVIRPHCKRTISFYFFYSLFKVDEKYTCIVVLLRVQYTNKTRLHVAFL